MKEVKISVLMAADRVAKTTGSNSANALSRKASAPTDPRP